MLIDANTAELMACLDCRGREKGKLLPTSQVGSEGLPGRLPPPWGVLLVQQGPCDTAGCDSVGAAQTPRGWDCFMAPLASIAPRSLRCLSCLAAVPWACVPVGNACWISKNPLPLQVLKLPAKNGEGKAEELLKWSYRLENRMSGGREGKGRVKHNRQMFPV